MANSCKLHRMHWVDSHRLAVGATVNEEYFPTLQKQGIRALIVARRHLPLSIEIYKKAGINILHIPVQDRSSTNLGQYFPLVYQFIEFHRKQGHGVLVHCAAGKSRSVTLTASYLMRKYHMSAENALSQLQTIRSCVGPNRGFRAQLKHYHILLQEIKH